MKSAIRLAPGRFRMRHLARLAAPSLVALALLPASAIASAPPASHGLTTTLGPSPRPTSVDETTQSPCIELAGRKSGDESFDPYGKDDPTNKKWGAAAGLLGNRYGGMRTGGGDAKNGGRKDGKGSDRDDRELRAPRAEEGGKN